MATRRMNTSGRSVAMQARNTVCMSEYPVTKGVLVTIMCFQELYSTGHGLRSKRAVLVVGTVQWQLDLTLFSLATGGFYIGQNGRKFMYRYGEN